MIGEQIGEAAKTGLIIDVSKNNGLVNWAKVKSDPQNITGAILKASEGATVGDKRFWENVKGCVNNGLDWGAYHFATWYNEDEQADATAEAKWFLYMVNHTGLKPTLPLVLDIESNKPIPYTKAEMVSYVSTFLNIITAAGYESAIYSSPGFLNSYLPADHPFTTFPLWVADYTGAINLVPGWKEYWLHQYSDKGKVEGIAGNVDMNRLL